MGEANETIKSPEEVLTAKKENLKKKLRLMFDYRGVEIEKSILARLNEFTDPELDYLLNCVEYSDNQHQLKGPLAKAAVGRKLEIKEKMGQLENQIGSVRAKEFRDLFYIGD